MATKAKRRMRSWARIAWTLAWRQLRKDTKDRALMAYFMRPGITFGPSPEMKPYYCAASEALYNREIPA